VYGQVDLITGLTVLMLAPEVYKPLREVGAQFHASADGIAAGAESFTVIETAVAAAGTRTAPDLRVTDIVLDAVSVAAPGRATWAPWQLGARLRPGRVIALVGPSGVGKTTAANAVLGLLRPEAGSIWLEPSDTGRGVGGEPDARIALDAVDPDSWWAQIAWVPQRPVIVPGTVRANVLADATGEIDAAVSAAAHATGFDEVLAELPGGWDALLGQGGVGLSLGQRQRLALTRALVGSRQLVILDEPTAHLDARAEEHVLAAVDRLREQGRTVLVIAHRASLIAHADDVVVVASRADDGNAGGGDAGGGDAGGGDAGDLTGADPVGAAPVLPRASGAAR